MSLFDSRESANSAGIPFADRGNDERLFIVYSFLVVFPLFIFLLLLEIVPDKSNVVID